MTSQTSSQPAAPKVAVVGLGAMGLGMATSLLGAGLDVVGCDVSEACRARFEAAGGRVGETAADAASGADILLCVVVNAAQTESLLFGEGGVASILRQGAVFISCATMDPAGARRMGDRLQRQGRWFLDAPISGGAARAAKGELTVMASGAPEAFQQARPVLDAVAATVHQLGDIPGQGAAFKMINQLLAGVHIAAACEAITFAAKQGLDLPKVYEVITGSAGNSWMFENRVPHVLAGDYTPLSAIEIFVKDLGIVQDMARASRYPAPMAAAALQLYLAAAGAGMGGDDDASLARLYAQLSGASLPGRMDA